MAATGGDGSLGVGVALGTIGADATWWLESAHRLEAAGYEALWAWDHFVGKGDRSVPVLEQWTLLAAAAATTERIAIGSFVTNVMNRHPAVLARMVATVQAIARGRIVLGLGIGGHPAEHRAYGIGFPPPAERAARLEEAIMVIRALWSGGPVTFRGAFYPLENAVAFPVPEPRPPILVGAGTAAGVRLAARFGDGWAAEADTFTSLMPTFLETLASEGRPRSEVSVTLGFGGGRTGVDALAGSSWVTDPVAERARWNAAGADAVVLTARTEADVAALEQIAGLWSQGGARFAGRTGSASSPPAAPED